MARYSRYAPYTAADWADRILWWASRLGAVVFLFSVVGVTALRYYQIFTWGVILGIFVWPAAWILRWLLHRYVR